jgi:hypothetical protein
MTYVRMGLLSSSSAFEAILRDAALLYTPGSTALCMQQQQLVKSLHTLLCSIL